MYHLKTKKILNHTPFLCSIYSRLHNPPPPPPSFPKFRGQETITYITRHFWILINKLLINGVVVSLWGAFHSGTQQLLLFIYVEITFNSK